MEVKQLTIFEFEANCSDLLEQVQKTKQPILITCGGKPLAEIVPATEEPVVSANREWIGSMKGKSKS